MPNTTTQTRVRPNPVGVGYIEAEGVWQARLRLHGKKFSLGRFSRRADAIKARMGGEMVYFGEVTTKPCAETQEFYDAMVNADNPYYYATAAFRRSRIKNSEGVHFSKDRWSSYKTKGHELIVLGQFKTYMEAYTRTQLEHGNLYEKED